MFVAIFTKLPKDLKNLKKTSIPKNRRWNLTENNPKLGLSPSKKVVFLCFNESPLKMMKNVFYFMLKHCLFLRYFNFCLDFLVMQKNSLIRKLELISKFVMSQTGQQIIAIHILPNISKSKSNQTIKFCQLIECIMRNNFWKKIHNMWWRG